MTVEDYLRESGYEVGAGAQYDLDGEAMPAIGEGLPLLGSLPQFSDVTLEGIFIYNVLPLIIVAALWYGRSGRWWNILTKGPASVPEKLPLIDPKSRDAHYGAPLNVARYLVDLHDSQAVFNFCGSFMFQLSLSPTLREHLERVAQEDAGGDQQPKIFDPSFDRLFKTERYAKVADADNVCVFHGREVRQVPTAAGGQGCVLHLSFANAEDPEGWTQHEIADYNGWAHDSGRPWRKGEQLEREGFQGFCSKFGAAAYSLHHRFYLHLDHKNAMWLSAEDGCEGEPWPL